MIEFAFDPIPFEEPQYAFNYELYGEVVYYENDTMIKLSKAEKTEEKIILILQNQNDFSKEILFNLCNQNNTRSLSVFIYMQTTKNEIKEISFNPSFSLMRNYRDISISSDKLIEKTFDITLNLFSLVDIQNAAQGVSLYKNASHSMLHIPDIKYTSFSTMSNNFLDYKFPLKEDLGLLMIAAAFTIKRIDGIVEHFQSHQLISSYNDIPQLTSKKFNSQVLKNGNQSFIIQKNKEKFLVV